MSVILLCCSVRTTVYCTESLRDLQGEFLVYLLYGDNLLNVSRSNDNLTE